MKKILLSLLLLSSIGASADRYFTKTGHVSFFSSALLEDIEAHNNKVGILLDTEKEQLNFSLLIKNYIFSNSLMQQHFNEKYLESDKYPKSILAGKISDLSKVDFSKDGTYPVKVSGSLKIHGVTKSVSETGTITIKNGKVLLNASFKLAIKDYGIKIPSLVGQKIAEVVTIKIDAELSKI
jgi:hypothetical protein